MATSLAYIRKILRLVNNLIDELPRCSQCKKPGYWIGAGPKYYCDAHKTAGALRCRWANPLEILYATTYNNEDPTLDPKEEVRSNVLSIAERFEDRKRSGGWDVPDDA
jgi:hypothetical protein